LSKSTWVAGLAVPETNDPRFECVLDAFWPEHRVIRFTAIQLRDQTLLVISRLAAVLALTAAA
jgi:hypothetical protein